MAVTQSELVRTWRHVLDMCKVHSGETVALLTRPGANAQNLAAAYHALEDIGCHVFELQPLIKSRPLRENKVAMEALRNSNFILDFIGLHLLRTYELDLITETGARMLYVVEPPEALVRLVPTVEDKLRVQRAGEKLRGARKLRVQSDAGTDMSVAIGDYKVLLEYGYSDEPGHWDHWPAGFLATWPNEGSANGVVVLEAGDIIFPFKSYVRSPIRLDIEGGYIRKISGGFDADLLREFMAQHKDPEAYAVSHLGWGLSSRARWTALALLGQGTNGNDGRSFEGNFLFSTGPNTDGGGKRDTLCHLDIPMRNCSVSLDGVPVTERGVVLDN
ncbi:MAG: 2,5-dihydroxypyridine 5,6-dioxygenase [Burkholderiaceae bacterium]|nr:2,5-dihydroxypyridine 5,6-dioxygenase [Burkholderiaceae bacterium]MDO9090138.1 2,5-dihydroxypyridine 5,6-dioxygenase [Burkholderiaceae bacterium]